MLPKIEDEVRSILDPFTYRTKDYEQTVDAFTNGYKICLLIGMIIGIIMGLLVG